MYVHLTLKEQTATHSIASYFISYNYCRYIEGSTLSLNWDKIGQSYHDHTQGFKLRKVNLKISINFDRVKQPPSEHDAVNNKTF